MSNTNKLAALLRWVGISIFAMSAVVFLLQGLDSVDTALRNWTYLILMVVVGAFGVGVHKLLQDGKSARLLLGAGVALIPVQFAQLGGLVHDLFGTDASTWLSTAGPLDIPMLLIGGAASVLLALPIAFMGFRVLASSHARLLTLAMVGASSVIILPWRDGPLALAVLAVLGAATVLFDRRFIRNNPISRTLEGRSVRLLLLIPVAIVAARLGFYVDTLQGVAVFGGMAAVALIAISQTYINAPRPRELVLFIGTLLGMLSWMSWVADLPASVYQVQFAFTSLAFVLIGISHLSNKATAYRNVGAAIFALSTINLIVVDYGLLNPAIALAAGVVMAALGYARKWREPVISGLLVTVMALVAMAVQSLTHVDFSSWLGLAVAGIMLVVAAAILERHGRSIYARTAHGWQQLKAW